MLLDSGVNGHSGALFIGLICTGKPEARQNGNVTQFLAVFLGFPAKCHAQIGNVTVQRDAENRRKAGFFSLYIYINLFK
jgi:hypothetical protein